MDIEKARPISPREYDVAFGVGAIDEERKKLLSAALDHARDNRKFEIELYWKRATYFWTLIAATFAGYFAVLASNGRDPEKEFLAFVLSCIGFVFTFAWFQVNRGSKQWQANWEAHVDLLEDGVTGPLYKTVLTPAEPRTFVDRRVTGSAPMSVSKINQVVSVFTLCIWALLALHAAWPLSPRLSVSWKHWAFLAPSIAFCILIVFVGGTDPKSKRHEATRRSASISE
jgi:peptidoglycan/LPS O-acetylase OafA/YrhL